MRIQQNPKDSLRIETRQYAFEFRWKRLMAVLWVKRTHQRYLFFPGGACNPVGAHDKTLAFGKPSVKPNSDALVVRFSERSSIWKPKHNTYVFREDSIEFHYEVHGECRIERAHFFRGYVGDGERGMACDVDEIYSTAPNFQEKLNFHPGESFCISAGNVLEMPVGGQALASPCYCMGFHDRRDRKYLSVGLATVPGQWTWDSFQWNPPVSFPVTPLACDNALAGGFAAVYDGKLRVNGIWQSPRLVMTFARDREDVLRRYLGHCCQRGYLPKPRRRRVVSWWREPTYCTWHDQNGLAASKVGFDVVKIGPASFDLCTQKLCDRWVRLLERQHCKPGIVILDATWSTNLNSGEPDPAKWRDMRGWIDACHERDIHVFVWTVAWATEGLPLNECITRDGKAVACDMTNPKFLRRFREMVRRWFSNAPDCLNADGVKVDGQLGLPTGKGLKSHGEVWGLELQRLYLKSLREEARRHKADACISTFALNPYLSEYTDMVRLGDMYSHRPTARESMHHRAALYRVAMPHAVIDTDGQFFFNMIDDCADVFCEQARLGVPTLYNGEWVLRTRFFQPMSLAKFRREDYRRIATVMARYRKRVRSLIGVHTPE